MDNAPFSDINCSRRKLFGKNLLLVISIWRNFKTRFKIMFFKKIEKLKNIWKLRIFGIYQRIYIYPWYHCRKWNWFLENDSWSFFTLKLANRDWLKFSPITPVNIRSGGVGIVSVHHQIWSTIGFFGRWSRISRSYFLWEIRETLLKFAKTIYP